MHTLLAMWLFTVGLVVGSFLNVVIARLPNEQSVVRPRSRCPACGHALPWYENIPIFSWLALRGRCSSCRAPISARYPAVELLTGWLFLACLARFGWTLELVVAVTFIGVALALAFIDAEHWILPFELTLPGTLAILALRATAGWASLATALTGAALGFLCFRGVEFLGWRASGGEALGAGDKYLLALIGATLGWRPLLAVVLFASVQGASYGLIRRALTGRAGPAPEGDPPASAEPEGPARWTPAFLAPGLPWWRRALLLPYALLLQDVPDPPQPDATGDEPAWTPSPGAMPFGPWLFLGGVQVLLLDRWLEEHLRGTLLGALAQALFSAER